MRRRALRDEQRPQARSSRSTRTCATTVDARAQADHRRGDLGEIVFAQIDMHAIPHWQGFLEGYDRLTLSNMSVHHLDALRFLFGDPDEVTSLTRPDPRTKFAHTDGIVMSTLRFPSGLLAVSLEDVWSGPRAEGYEDDQHIDWRVEGTEGVAKGTIGWPTGAPSTLSYASQKSTGGKWVTPDWETMWFPHAFIGVMEQLQHAVKTGKAPALSVADNVPPGRWYGSRLPLIDRAREPSGFPKSISTGKLKGEDQLMNARPGIFTAYFPYTLETKNIGESVIRGPRLQHQSSSTCTSRAWNLRAPGQHQPGQSGVRIPRNVAPTRRSADSGISGYTNLSLQSRTRRNAPQRKRAAQENHQPNAQHPGSPPSSIRKTGTFDHR